MKKSIQQSSNSGNERLRALIKSNKSYVDDLADVKICNDVAVSLFNLRSNAGITQKELAQKLGVKQSNISRWEKIGYQGYKLKMLSKIVRTLGGRLNVTIAPSVYEVVSYFALVQEESRKFELISPDGMLFRQEINQTTGFVNLNLTGYGAKNGSN